MRHVFSGAQIFDGTRLLPNQSLIVENGLIVGLEKGLRGDVVLDGGILAPAFVDLQVNGGGGISLDAQADAGRIAAICATHIMQGCAGVLPTLMPNSKQVTERVIAASIEAAQANVPGFLGLHLHGPHLAPLHPSAPIRPMSQADLDLLVQAAKKLPVLKVTLAPEAVSLTQVADLVRAGVLVSLGHSGCDYSVARDYIAAGARCATQLFNDMAPITATAPGLAGAVLDGTLPAGIIADGVTVSPPVLRLAVAARPEGLFLISNAMGGAAPDLRVDQAIARMIRDVGLAPSRAMAMATSVPAGVIGMQNSLGHLLVGRRADMVHLDADWHLSHMWWGGVTL